MQCFTPMAVEAEYARMSKVYDETEGAQATNAKERSEDRPDASCIGALIIGSVIKRYCYVRWDNALISSYTYF